MNKLVIIGNLVRTPETRTTTTGKTVCSFTVAVNRRRGGENAADYFRVSAWDKLGENCQKYLDKGRKVCVVGEVTVSTYEGKDGATKANLEVSAQDVEFLSPKEDAGGAPTANGTPNTTAPSGFVEVSGDDLPF